MHFLFQMWLFNEFLPLNLGFVFAVLQLLGGMAVVVVILIVIFLWLTLSPLSPAA